MESTALSQIPAHSPLRTSPLASLWTRSVPWIVALSFLIPPSALASGGLVGVQGGAPLAHVRNVYSSTSVTTAAYVQIVASSPNVPVNGVEIFDSSGQTLVLATGASGAEVDRLIIFPGGNGAISVQLPPNVRISLKALSADATTGEIDLNLYR